MASTYDLEFSDPCTQSQWIVNLRFVQEYERFGTGFYINIPNAEFHVILTAGHNLIDRYGNLSTHLSIDPPPTVNLPTEWKIFISPSFKANPEIYDPDVNWGVILVPKYADDDQCGFGFSLKLAYDDFYNEQVAVQGYKYSSTRRPVISSGKCLACHDSHLEYGLLTTEAFAGSPVFVGYRGQVTAIAIHNSKFRGRGLVRGTGARISEGVLEQIFRWLGIGHWDKSLRVAPSEYPALNLEGLYLRFRPDNNYAWVRLGNDGLDTSFDIFPAYAPPSSHGSPASCSYIFRFRFPLNWPASPKHRWVLWDIEENGVTLADTIQEFCLVKICRKKGKDPDLFYLLLDPEGPRGDRETLELQMAAIELTNLDIAMGYLDTPEISFRRHARGRRLQVGHNIFSFY